ncbi:MAG: M20/M25/M40 family metallo-hydrolase [Gemmatimonadota bacterium]|nr:MAG: M20/M25/M40 family metallo-hydrolase [Gemmatimonadota bacterium]
MVHCSLAFLLLLPAPLFGQSAAIQAVREYREAHEAEIVGELVGFLGLPNVADDLDAIRENAQALAGMLRRRGIEPALLETGGAPYVYGERKVAGAERTVLFYAHYDGQPVDVERWVGHRPFQPVLRDKSLEAGGRRVDLPAAGKFDPDWRLYARSAADDKAPIIALLAGLDALAAAGLEPTVNLKFLFEGDEEAGSPHLAEVVDAHAELLHADLVVAADGPSDPSGLPTLYFGARGIVSVQITVYGPLRPLHSGHYGNWAPNPALRLAQLLASMKDPESGKVLIADFYDGMRGLSDFERQALEAAPDDDAEQLRAFGLAEPEATGKRLALINEPSLNVRGLRSGWVGAEARTIVPDLAVADLDLRLVKGIDPREQVARLVAHVRGQGFEVVKEEPDLETRLRHPRLARIVSSDGYPAFRTSMDLAISRAIITAVEENSGRTAVKLPTLGGSVPLYVFTDVLEVPTIGIPIVNHDNNQHGPNENLRLGHLWSGIEVLVAAMLLD